MAAPIIDELSEEFKGKAVVGKVNVDENNQIAAQFGVMSIPFNIIIDKEGTMADRFSDLPKDPKDLLNKVSLGQLNHLDY